MIQSVTPKVDSNHCRFLNENDANPENVELADYVLRRPFQPGKESNYLHDIYRKVESADPNGLRCLVTNSTDTTDVELIQYVNRNTLNKNDTMVSNIEWWWGLQKGSLRLDTRYNTIPLTTSMYSLLGKRSWVLLPPLKIVQEFHDTLEQKGKQWDANRKNFLIINNGTFEYDFIPVNDTMKRRTIHRQEQLVEYPNEEHYSAHTYPFKTLPKLISHLHPKYAVLAAGLCVNLLIRDLDTDPELAIEILSGLDERLLMAAHIALAWTSRPPSTAESDPDCMLEDQPRPSIITNGMISGSKTPFKRPPGCLHENPAPAQKLRTG